MNEQPVLVLNRGYEPLNICRARRALTLIFDGKAEMLENGTGFIHTVAKQYELPSVIRMAYFIKRPVPKPRLSRLEIFHRDNHTCQYCGKKSAPLTVDHVVPRNQHGQHTWENLVTACAQCNRRKAGRTPEQAGMKLLQTPRRPAKDTFYYIRRHTPRPQWQKYLPNGKKS
jgi:5-methylcytosine-specific restriction endonuclease McrA